MLNPKYHLKTFFSITSLILLSACGGSGGVNGDEFTNLAPTVTNVNLLDVNGGTADLGDTLIGNYTYNDADNDPEGTSTFRWFRNTVVISGETNNSYTLTTVDQGQSIQFEVTPVASVGTLLGAAATSNAINATQPTVNSAPNASNVSVLDNNGGLADLGDTLIASYSYNDADADPEGTSTFRWFRNNVFIISAVNSSYILTSADQGQSIHFTVTPMASAGNLRGTTVRSNSINAAPVDTTPNAFSFTDQTNVTVNTIVTSSSTSISGINNATTISISNGEYSLDGGAYTNSNSTLINGQTVVIRQTTSSLLNTVTTSTLTIGGVSANFSTTTGPIGTGFNKAKGFDNNVKIVSPTTDGSGDIYVGGYFTTYNGISSNRIIRLNSDGTIDTVFNVGTGFNSFVSSIAIDVNGDVYVGGNFTTYNGITSNNIIRLNSDGSIDTDFNVKAGFNNDVNSIAIDANGDVYMGGYFTTYNGTTSNRIIHLNSDGSIDTVFDVGTGFNAGVISLTIDPNGDVYVGGYFATYNRTPSNHIIRLNSNGSIDTTFNVGSGFDNLVSSLVTNSNGEVYVGGNFTTYNGSTSNRIIRLNSDGSIDTAFNVGSGFNGLVITITSGNSGDVYVGGGFFTYNGTSSQHIIRLNNDGTIDTAFNIGTGFENDVRSIANDANGGVYVGGYFTTYNAAVSNHIAHLSMTGIMDTTFNQGSGFNDLVTSISPTTGGSAGIYLGGSFTTYNTTPSNRIIRLNSDGSIDTSFNIGTGFNNNVRSIVSDTNGSVYVGGSFTMYNGTTSSRIIRLNGDGSIDTSFNTGTGFFSFLGASVSSIAVDANGDIYVGGNFTTYNGTTSNRIIRLNSDGSIDTSFNIGTGFDNNVNSIAIDVNGDVYIGGSFTTYKGITRKHIIRLNSNGSVDTSFNNIGTGFNDDVNSIATDANGNVYVGGDFTTYKGNPVNRIIHLNSDSSVNTSFNVGTGFNLKVISIATDANGDIYLAGNFTSYNGTASNRIIRLNSDGSVNTAFNVGTGLDKSAFIISPATDGSGDVFLGGDFSTYNRVAVDRMVRLNADGSLN